MRDVLYTELVDTGSRQEGSVGPGVVEQSRATINPENLKATKKLSTTIDLFGDECSSALSGLVKQTKEIIVLVCIPT